MNERISGSTTKGWSTTWEFFYCFSPWHAPATTIALLRSVLAFLEAQIQTARITLSRLGSEVRIQPMLPWPVASPPPPGLISLPVYPQTSSPFSVKPSSHHIPTLFDQVTTNVPPPGLNLVLLGQGTSSLLPRSHKHALRHVCYTRETTQGTCCLGREFGLGC